MNYDHPILRDMVITAEGVETLKRRMDDDLAQYVEGAQQSNDPEHLATVIAEASVLMAKRLRENN